MPTKIVIALVFLLYSLLVGRLYYLMVKKHQHYNQLSYKNFIRTVPIPPVRGVIYDRTGVPVAYNQMRFDLLLQPHLKPKELNATLHWLHSLLPDLNITKMARRYHQWNSPYTHRPIIVARYLSKEQLYPVEPLLQLNPLVSIQTSYLRKYPFGAALANVVGYISDASKRDLKRNKVIELTHLAGKQGIERYYDDILQGEPGYKREIVDAKNRVLAVLFTQSPLSTSITLTIDHRLQQFIYNLLKQEQKRGAVVVMKTNGEVLALVTYPSYDDNLFVKGISRKEWEKLIHDIYHPLWNRPIMGLYPPGSTVKPAEGLIALASGAFKPDEKIYCPYYIEVGHRKFRDWKPGGHGWTDIYKAIEESVDTYFYKVGLKLGIDYIASHLKKMGFGEKTGIDLPGEKSGLVPTKEWKWKRYHKKWLIGETLNAVIGQGYFLATPIQVARNTALLASGKLPTPFLAKEIGGVPNSPLLADVLTKKEKEFLPDIRKGMYLVCQGDHGTATRHITTPIELGCKTGTAQVYSIPQEVKERKREEELAYFKRSHAWLTTYGPWKHPQVVVTVLIEHGGHGGSAAGPIVSKIYNWLIKHGYIVVKPSDLAHRPNYSPLNE